MGCAEQPSDELTQKEKDDACKAEAKLSNEKRQNAKDYAKIRDIATYAQAKDYLQHQEDLVAKQVAFISLPFLGISLDINDLGILGGLALIIVLLWLRFSLWREEDNIRYLFSAEQFQGEARKVYRLVAMTQVFLVPPTPEREKTGKISLVLHVLYSLPAVVQFLVVLNDIMTAQQGMSISSFATFLLLIGESICFGAVVVLTILIQIIVVDLQGTWRDQFNKIFAKGVGR